MTTDRPLPEKEGTDLPWWKGAVIYQIYPRSFQDSNGDGVGDLQGICERLEYIASLGVSGIWISPFFTSPMKDFGYDVSDYCDVDPVFGTLEDFDRLVTKAHELDLKVIIDQVYAHTSDEHLWFAESRQSRAGPLSDWYVWQDPKPDGSPPNNWQAVFGGAAWTWDARRQQYYMHNFLPSQPQLNLHNRKVQDALLEVARFWLDRGVDGFRLDAINFAMFDPKFKDNPAADVTCRTITRPFDLQQHVHNQSHPDIPEFLERVRAVMEEYDAIFSVAEVPGEDPLAEMRAFTQGETRLHSAYSFDFLYAEELTAARIKQSQYHWMGGDDEGWPSWAFSNHDAPRCISRWFRGAEWPRYAKLTNALLMSLRGNPILYQGEELGLPQTEVPFELLKDPEAIANWPLTLGRDGARTPMPWTGDSDTAGFTIGDPWLPISDEHKSLSVNLQENDPQSVLSFTRQLVSLRKTSLALCVGSIRFLEGDDNLVGVQRFHGDEVIQCVFHLAAETRPKPVWMDGPGTELLSSGYEGARHDVVPPLSCRITKIHPRHQV